MKPWIVVLSIAALLHISVSVSSTTFEQGTLEANPIVTRFCQELEARPSLLFPASCMTLERKENIGKIAQNYTRAQFQMNPIVMVPGLGGSVLETKLENSVSPDGCAQSYNWKLTWTSIITFLTNQAKCVFHAIKLNYNSVLNRFDNNRGVSVRVKDFGGVHGIDYLDDGIFGSKPLFGYYGYLIEELKSIGYVPGKNLHGAPFDWRHYSNNVDFYVKYKRLIETTYETNGQKKVILIGHSMGTLQTTMFLSTVSQEWKDKYIKTFVAVSGPWSGASMALRTLLSGNDLIKTFIGIPFFNPLEIRNVVREMGAIAWLLPDIKYWDKVPLVKTPNKVYTPEDYQEVLALAGANSSYTIFTRGVSLHKLDAPGVEMHCVLSTNYPTEISYTYKQGFDKDPEITYDPLGDGIVPVDSLRQCYGWAEKQRQPVHKKEWVGPHHITILSDPEFIKYLFDNIL